ncbi:MAG TPA: metallopeptidase family protein [Candidatus Bathyarchaeia archaeon]|nr:metallopeptidase family protein [Candidatus Bathyarchaeia archaeon]
MRVSKDQFEKWVAEAVDGVPEKFRKRIHNLAFFVEDRPTKEQLKKARLAGRKDTLLFGLYEGYYQSKRLDLGPVFPDRITLFKKSLESFCQTREELRRQIASTVRHEIAHHFGSDEAGAQKAGKRK